MYDFVLLCKTFRGDLKRFQILKESVDKYNADKIPFYIVCPECDKGIFQEYTNTSYLSKIVTDEEVLAANNINCQEQNWHSQQIIKLGFYKLKLADFYAVIDSDLYFIQNFYYSDFMYDEKTPYFYISEILNPKKEQLYIQNYLKRDGKCYDFIYNSQVFSRIVLEDMEKRLLNKNDMNLVDLINLCPYEFNWYGEWFLYANLIPMVYTRGKIKVFWKQLEYIEAKESGFTEKDFIEQGYIAILMQNRWVKDSKYKPSIFYKLIKIRKNILDKL